MKKQTITAFCASAMILAEAAGAQTPALPAIQVPPLIQPVAVAYKLIGWRAGGITCNGAIETPLSLPIPDDRIVWTGIDSNPPKQATINFAIDATGRPHSIYREISRNEPDYAGLAMDLPPVLATAQFRPGGNRSACAITYVPEIVDMAAATVDRLIAYSLFPSSLRMPKIGYDRVRMIVTPGSTCLDPLPAVRNRAFPDFQSIPQVPGTRSWSMISYDIDRQGRPTNVRVARSTGNAALDRASAQAVAQSRFGPGARRGCLYPYWRRGAPLAAPPIPDNSAQSPNPGCPVAKAWKTQPVLRFPEAYRRRGVEGWGIVAYDVAPWGATGNLRVIASEPSADFGIAAMDTVRSATREPSPQGYTNCQARVRFVTARPGQEAMSDTAAVSAGDAVPPPF